MNPLTLRTAAVPPHIAALNKAKIALMSKPDTVFFTTVCLSLKYVWDDTVPTAATDGTTVFINPTYFLSLDADRRDFLLVHEATHVAYMHMARLMGRDMLRWNYAADYVINFQLVARGFKIHPTWLYGAQYADMSAEQVYDLITLPLAPEFPVDLREAPIPEDLLQREVEDILVRASVASRMAGDSASSVPGDFQIFLDRLLNPVLPWNRILQKYLSKFAKNDYSYRKPSRRFFPKWILPSLFSTALMDFALFIDTSGSVSQADFNRFVSETHAILRMMKPEKLTLGQFDTAIKSVNTIRTAKDLMDTEFVGRGGTRIAPVLNWIRENRPEATLIFTDGGFAFPKGASSPGDVIWVIHNNPGWVAPFGKTIHYST